MGRYGGVVLALGLALVNGPEGVCAQTPNELAQKYGRGILSINQAHVRKPGKTSEADLGKKLPGAARRALEDLLEMKPSADVAEALYHCGESALELVLVKDFERVRARLSRIDPHRAEQLGSALDHPRFLLRGLGGLDDAYLQHFATILEAILVGYDELFGFAEWSKVPGKKLRVRVHLEERITRPPHFAPQYPFHSEIDFPVVDPKALRSPTKEGQFLFYGLCHELGHVIAMWGDRKNEEDHHAWAHYTGVVLVEYLAEKHRSDGVLQGIRDVRWRSLEGLRKKLAETPPGLGDREGVLAFLIALHDGVGPRAIGTAFNFMDARGQAQRIQHVRYYRFETLHQALLSTLKNKKKRRGVAQLFETLNR